MKHLLPIAIAVCTGLLLTACQQPDANNAGAAPVEETPAQAPDTDQQGQENSGSSGLSRVLQANAIGATKAFLERSLGLSTYETEYEASYLVDGCNVTLGLNGNSVDSVSIALAPGCRFDMAALAGSPQPLVIDGVIRFSQFEAFFGQARYTSPCLAMCGNAYDPYVDAVVQGARVDDFIDIAAQVLFVGDAAVEAASVWRDQLTATAGEEYVLTTQFNCDARHNEIPRAAFADVTVETIQFGRDLGTRDCQ